MNSSSIALVILAAGQAQRFGSPKQLAKFNGQYLLKHILTQTIKTGLPVYVVLGAHSSKIKAAINFEQANIIENSDWEKGVSSSIQKAVKELQSDYDYVLFMAGDQIKIDSEDLKRLIATVTKEKDKLIAASYAEDIGIPAIFPKRYYSQLLELSGDKGGKKILKANQQNLILVEMLNAEIDIDFPEDLIGLEQS